MCGNVRILAITTASLLIGFSVLAQDAQPEDTGDIDRAARREAMDQRREAMRSMSEEQRAAVRAQHEQRRAEARKRYDAMSEEERAAMREKRRQEGGMHRGEGRKGRGHDGPRHGRQGSDVRPQRNQAPQ